MASNSESTLAQTDKCFWVFIFWTLICLTLFFWKIPPRPFQSLQYLLFSIENSSWNWTQVLQSWLRHLLLLLTFLGSLIVFIGSGKRLLDWVNPQGLSAIENWVWSLAFGWFFWGILAEGLAFEKIFYPTLLKTFISFTLLVFLITDKFESLKRCWPFHGPLEIPRLWWWPIGMVLILSLSNLVAPEMSWDAITYQLVLPKFYFIRHGFYPVTGIVPAQYPALGQMFFSWGLLWGTDSLARSFSFLAHLGTALALVGIGSRLMNLRIGWLAAFIYWVFPYLNIFSTRGYVDLFLNFYVVLGLGYLIVLGQSQKNNENWNAIAFMPVVSLGIIWGIKYNAASFWTAGVILLLLVGFNGIRFLWGCLVFAPWFFFLPWALKNWEYAHNPVFPYFSNFFHGFDWNAFDAKASMIKFEIEGFRGLAKLPLLPWKVFFENYSGAPNEEITLVPLILFPVITFFLILRWKELEWKKSFLVAMGTIEAIKAAGLRDPVRIIVGGAPISPSPTPTRSGPTAMPRTPPAPCAS